MKKTATPKKKVHKSKTKSSTEKKTGTKRKAVHHKTGKASTSKARVKKTIASIKSSVKELEKELSK